ncbi:MAG: hypothetical protein J6C37_10520 [Roseburia sp.]|nr:hypothetical protein [Roseburia sp.]
MSYPNEFLQDFRQIYFSILKAKHLRPERVKIEVIDEESEGYSVFEPADVRDVLMQLSCDLNFLTIYTDRPAYFSRFAETMYEENGLVVLIFPKIFLKSGGKKEEVHGGQYDKAEFCQNNSSKINSPSGGEAKVILDFEWEGKYYDGQMRVGNYYIPIHKKPWETAENLDIVVPIGYNTVIVKRIWTMRKKPRRDRLEEAFYNE